MSLSSSINKLNLNSTTSADSLKEMEKELTNALNIVNQRLQTFELHKSESSPGTSKNSPQTGNN